MLAVEEVGSLAVAWSPSDKETVNRELRKLSPTLFLDPELDPDMGLYWTVKDYVRSGPGGTITVLAWRDGAGRPKPLTLAIVDQVKRQEGAMDGAVKEILASQDRRRDKLRANAEDTYETITGEHIDRMKAAESRTLPAYWRPRRFGAGT